jgi:hypothetical protein
VRWMVRAPAGGPLDLTVTVRSARAGRDAATLTLDAHVGG